MIQRNYTAKSYYQLFVSFCCIVSHYVYHLFLQVHSMIQVEVVIAAGKQIYAQVNREVNARRISQKDYIIDEAQPRNRPPSDHAISCDFIRLAVKTCLAEWPSLKAYLALRSVTSNPSSQNGKSQPTKKLWPQCYFNCLYCLICLWLLAFVSTIFAGMDKSDVVLIWYSGVAVIHGHLQTTRDKGGRKKKPRRIGIHRWPFYPQNIKWPRKKMKRPPVI